MTNDELDAVLLELLTRRTLKFHQIQACIGAQIGINDGKLYRQIDRRLQALRKRSEVSFSSGFGWKRSAKS